MNEIELGKTGLRAPQLGFGCAALLGRAGRSESLRALAAAWEEGIRFFDTARSYGYGESEALVGEFLRGRRDLAIIATKFGILPAPQAKWKQAAKVVVRQALAVAPWARGIVRKSIAGQFTPNAFTVAVLEQSINESLRKLGTDYVDFLLMHSAPASVLGQEDLLEALGRLVEAGKVRVAGLSSDPEVVALALERQTKPLGAMQFPCNVFDLSVAATIAQRSNDAVLVANHPFGGVARVRECAEILRGLSQKPELDAALREKLASKDSTLLGDVVLNSILLDTGIHVVIPAMMRVEHIRANVRAVTNSRFNAQEIAQIRQALIGSV
jgi:aryl-alcohol dehydrogenase-like predicted oxidoreductase